LYATVYHNDLKDKNVKGPGKSPALAV